MVARQKWLLLLGCPLLVAAQCTPGVAPPPPDGGSSHSGNPDSGAGHLTHGFTDGGPGSIGDPCNTDSSCFAGPDPGCIPEVLDGGAWASGYCTSNCATDLDCPNGNVCVDTVEIQAGAYPFRNCMLKCTSNANCREKYNCVSQDDAQFCLAWCVTSLDCPEVGETCNPVTGLCLSAAPDAGIDGGVPIFPDTFNSALPAPPQEVSAGGPELTAPHVVPIFFSNDSSTAVQEITSFLNSLPSSGVWAATSEYHLTALTIDSAVTLSTAPSGTVTDTQIQQMIPGVASKSPATSNTVYVFHFPLGTTITNQSSGGTQTSCTDFFGYHSAVQLNNSNVAYAVMPRCPASPGLTILDSLTAAETHEIVEASTDPFSSAYVSVDADHIIWPYVLGASEIADMCEADPESYFEFPASPYVVQRIWSNDSANAGHDPCVPLIPGEVFFNAVPVLPDTFLLQGTTTATKSINASPGTAVSLTLDLYSDGRTGAPFTVSLEDMYAWGYGMSPTISFNPDTYTGWNGDQFVTEMTVSSFPQDSANGVVVTVTLGGVQHYWFAMVGKN